MDIPFDAAISLLRFFFYKYTNIHVNCTILATQASIVSKMFIDTLFMIANNEPKCPLVGN